MNCILCNSESITIITKRCAGTSSRGNEYDFPKQYYKCIECGFEYVDFEMSSNNYRRQQNSILRIKQIHKLKEIKWYRGIKIER